MATTVWATRSATVGTPSMRTPPCDFGISTPLTGGGKYDPDDIRFQIRYRLFFRSSSKAAKVCPSTPGAPLLAATRLYASQTCCLGISNGLTCDAGMFSSLPPRTLRSWLIEVTVLMSRPLGSAPTSRQQGLHSYYGPVRQRTPHRYSVPTVSASARSPSRPTGPTLPVERPPYRRSPSHVPCKSSRPGSRRLCAGQSGGRGHLSPRLPRNRAGWSPVT